MFGSLVIVLPSAHSGGALHLRHGDKEVIHESSSKFNEPPYDSVSWIAFYSDVEHEVAVVESGYRVTLTYNLYFADEDPLESVPPAEYLASNALYKTFADLLAEPTFLPDGGVLGFGLEYDYPINPSTTQLWSLKNVLKGQDALLFSIAETLKLEPALKVVYKTDYHGTFLCDSFCGDNYGFGVQNIADFLRDDHGGQMIEGGEVEDEDEDERINLEVHWIGGGSKNMKVKSYFLAYGNEASLGEIYGRVNLILTVGNKDSRAVQ